jgi:Na+/proline symporter
MVPKGLLEDDEKSGPPAWLWPFGPAIAVLVVFPGPEIQLNVLSFAFKFFAAVGLLGGLAVGRNVADKQGRIRPKRKAIGVIVVLLAALLVVSARYFFYVRPHAANHFAELVVEFIASNILIGVLLFLFTPSITFVIAAFRGRRV